MSTHYSGHELDPMPPRTRRRRAFLTLAGSTAFAFGLLTPPVVFSSDADAAQEKGGPACVLDTRLWEDGTWSGTAAYVTDTANVPGSWDRVAVRWRVSSPAERQGQETRVVRGGDGLPVLLTDWPVTYKTHPCHVRAAQPGQTF